jgi:hypothetical protein
MSAKETQKKTDQKQTEQKEQTEQKKQRKKPSAKKTNKLKEKEEDLGTGDDDLLFQLFCCCRICIED